MVMLPDGSHVYLNAGTRLKYPDHFSDSTREVYLEGEAFFEVAHDSLHPFIVQAGQIATRVLGTSFNVRAYTDEPDMVVGVKTGKVKVSLVHAEQTVPRTRGITETILIKARQAIYHMGDADGLSTGDINPADVGAWSDNKLVYNNKTLAYILHELERVYNVRFKMPGEQELANRYTVRLGKMELNNTLNDLSLLANIGFTQQDSLIKVSVR
jgi:ferric-dicitrate binding protein FerR (iron transport regulator)